MYSMIIRTTLMFLLIMASVRIMGKKNLGEFQPSDLVATMLISNLTSMAIEAPELPILYSVIPILLIVCYEVFSSQFARSNNKLANFTQGKQKVLIKKGVIDQFTMNELRFTVDDILESMRSKDIFYLEEVALAIVETTGAVNIYPAPNIQTILKKAEIPPFAMVIDGKKQYENYPIVSFDDKKLENILKKENMDLSQILLLLYDGDDNYNITKKEII